jgi:hypothetical protein
MSTKPVGQLVLAQLPRRKREEGHDDLGRVDDRWIAVETKKTDRHDRRSLFVAIDKGMVARDSECVC